MIYLKRTLFLLLCIAYYVIVTPLCVLAFLIGFVPSFFIGYIITGDANIGPTKLTDFLSDVWEFMSKIEIKLNL